jgi:hypothetical protein
MCANQLRKSYQSLTDLTRSLTSHPYLNGRSTTKARHVMSVYCYPSRVISGLTLIQGNEFWSDGTKSTPRRLPPRSGPSPPRQRNFFDFLYFRRPVDASPSIPLKARRWNFSLFTGRIPAPHTVDVAPAQDDDVSRSSLMLPRLWHYCNNLQRYAIAPPTKAEVAAAMQYATENEVNGSAHQGVTVAGIQGPQEGSSPQTAQEQNPAVLTEESSDLIGCCGLYLVCRRSTSH